MSQTSLQEPVVSFDELAAKRMGRVRRYLRTHPRVVVVGTVVIYFFLALPNTVMMAYLPNVPPALYLLLTVSIGLALLWRRKAPLTVLCVIFVLEFVGILLAGQSGGIGGVGMAIALYSVGTSYSGRRAVPIALLAGCFQLLMMVLMGYPDLTDLTVESDADNIDDAAASGILIGITGGFLIGIYAAAAAIGTNIRNARIHEAELNHWASQVSRLAQVQERNRIAREMHDVVAHSLSVMIALSEGARVVGRRDQERSEQVLKELSGTGRAALSDMRRMLGVLRQSETEELELKPTGGSLDQMLEGFRVAGLPLTYTYTGEPLPEDTTFQLTVFRIIQESLTNSLRYAHNVSDVQVRMERCSSQVRIEIIDDGDATRVPSVGTGQGLRGMRERVALFGGTVNAGPVAQGGWIVKATLQMPEHSNEHLATKE
ncbi:sensor histidine kinase [Arthrobacter sp. MYb213]|uniref:sensor histidine kinase n=1 Tax=Arthrobacter sp. MYb213 TaxID=1848595 RepID=UPI000CFB0507|nr:sensor histidine kinase [Arthrobacter sp. MYb213]PRB70145.1 two-component sensor histidine kinase [Arthrobacter sp. MYb213]